MEHKQPVSEREVSERKPYEKPTIVYRQPLEARASVCTPAPPGKSDANCTQAFS